MLANLLTNHHDIAQQIHVESGLMNSLVEGLRAILAWKTQGDDFTRKLSTVAFVSKSLRRHLERLMNLEETDGYMDVVLETKPNLSKVVDQLRQEHDRFRHAAKRFVRRLEQMSSTDQDAFDRTCDELADFLQRLDRHSRREAELIQDTFEQEVGGEG
jgi:hemerythrin-like domain-containing protein